MEAMYFNNMTYLLSLRMCNQFECSYKGHKRLSQCLTHADAQNYCRSLCYTRDAITLKIEFVFFNIYNIFMISCPNRIY